MDGMTFHWQTDWFRHCMPLFSCLLEGAERIAAGKEGDLGKMGDCLGQIEHICDPVDGLKNCHYAGQMKNVRAVLLDLTQTDQKVELASYTLLPFLWELREEIYFWGCVAEDGGKRKAYWQEEFISHHRRVNPRRMEPKKVSIFIPACNHLDYTKQCVESVLRHTDLRECELLLLAAMAPKTKRRRIFVPFPMQKSFGFGKMWACSCFLLLFGHVVGNIWLLSAMTPL